MYARNLILVNLILVNLFGFFVIKSSHGCYKWRHQVEIVATGLPDLSKPSRDLLELRKTQFSRIKILKKNQKV